MNANTTQQHMAVVTRAAADTTAVDIAGAEPARIARFQALEPGSYWRYTGDVTRDVEPGTVLLLLSIEQFDGVPHTVSLRSHPRARREFTLEWLVQDFLNEWVYEPDGEKVRARELMELQHEIAQAQAELIDAQGNPALVAPVVAERLAAWEKEHAEQERRQIAQDADRGILHDDTASTPQSEARALALRQDNGRIRTDLAAAVEARLGDADVRALAKLAEREAVIAETKARWLEGKVANITHKVEQMAPFFAERSAVALARTKGVRDFARELMKGIKTLQLYTGVGVQVHTLVEGAGAPAEEPLTLMQRKLFADEEIAAHIDVDENFDFRDMDQFDERLATDPTLRDRILPTPRCVVSMAVRRQSVNYGNPMSNKVLNEINKQVFLLVRNGDNIHRVHSAEESHENSPRLFPTKDELDQPFRGLDGTRINFNDLRFTKATKRAEASSLHYKRFLVLLCGLDHRLKLFGDFHDEGESLSFISMGFQQRHMRFIADDERSHQLGEGRPDVGTWVASRNSFLQSGSRVLCFHRRLLSPTSAPSCQKLRQDGHRDWIDVLADPLQEAEILIAYRDGKELCVDVRVTRERRSWRDITQKEFNARVSLTQALQDDQLGLLCLDSVEPADLMWYVNSREDRVNHTDFIRMFKRTAQLLQAQAEREAPALAWIADAVAQAAFCAPERAPEAIRGAVRAWRCANRGAELPSLEDKKAFSTILSLAHSLTREDQFAALVERHAHTAGLAPLRAVLTGKNRLALYSEVPAHERDERLLPWRWVKRQSIEVLKTKTSVSSEKLVWLNDKPDAKESEVQTWPGLSHWLNRQDEPLKPADLRAACEVVASSLTRYKTWFAGHGVGIEATAFDTMLSRMTKHMRNDGGARTVGAAPIHLPIAAFISFHSRTGDVKGLRYLCVTAEAVHWLIHFGTPAQAAAAKRAYLGIYARPESHAARLNQPFAPRLTIQDKSMQESGLEGLYMGGDAYLREGSVDVATSGYREASGNAVNPARVFAAESTRKVSRSLDAAIAFWMRDVKQPGAKGDDYRPERVVLEPSIALRISSVDPAKEQARAAIAEALDLPQVVETDDDADNESTRPTERP